MSQEGQLLDKKSLRSVTGKAADWKELAKDCIAFANAQSKKCQMQSNCTIAYRNAIFAVAILRKLIFKLSHILT